MLSHSNKIENESISCLICKNDKERSEIIELQCTHIFCWVCMQKYLQENSDIKVKCPKQFCYQYLSDSEKRKIINEDDIEIYENKCLSSICNTYTCLLPQCGTVVQYTDPNTQYTCSVCTLYNCVSCKAPHTEYKCKNFQSLSPEIKTSYCKGEINAAAKIYEKRRLENVRKNMLSIEQIYIVYNDQIFECILCELCIGKGDGVVLKNCCCQICKPCLIKTIRMAPIVPILCPLCTEESINEEEIQSILPPELLSKYVDMCADTAKHKLDSHFKCQAVDCGALHHTKVTTTSFRCFKCKAVNCVPCNAVHINENCELYKLRMSKDKNQQFLEKQIRQGVIWPCIACKTLLHKVSGCNFIQCPNCKIELCWIRKMERWGPKGRGDNSGGCQCGVNGVRCHEDCIKGCMPDNMGNPVDSTNPPPCIIN